MLAVVRWSCGATLSSTSGGWERSRFRAAVPVAVGFVEEQDWESWCWRRCRWITLSTFSCCSGSGLTTLYFSFACACSDAVLLRGRYFCGCSTWSLSLCPRLLQPVEEQAAKSLQPVRARSSFLVFPYHSSRGGRATRRSSSWMWFRIRLVPALPTSCHVLVASCGMVVIGCCGSLRLWSAAPGGVDFQSAVLGAVQFGLLFCDDRVGRVAALAD